MTDKMLNKIFPAFRPVVEKAIFSGKFIESMCV